VRLLVSVSISAILSTRAGIKAGLGSQARCQVQRSSDDDEPCDPGFAKTMEKADDIMRRYRNTLNVLAQ
jgi:hypothetical protein